MGGSQRQPLHPPPSILPVCTCVPDTACTFVLRGDYSRDTPARQSAHSPARRVHHQPAPRHVPRHLARIDTLAGDMTTPKHPRHVIDVSDPGRILDSQRVDRQRAFQSLVRRYIQAPSPYQPVLTTVTATSRSYCTAAPAPCAPPRHVSPAASALSTSPSVRPPTLLPAPWHSTSPARNIPPVACVPTN